MTMVDNDYEVFESEYQERGRRPEHYSPLPAQAELVPFDVRHQYFIPQWQEVSLTPIETIGGIVYVYIEFNDGTYDEWEIKEIPEMFVNFWKGWRLREYGVVDENGNRTVRSHITDVPPILEKA